MQKDQKGFTLVELIVVVGILGVLAAIAIPAYTSYRSRADRAAAKAALVEGAQNMERYFTRNNSYEDATVGDPVSGDQVLAETEGGRYDLEFANDKVDGSNADTTTFTLQAVPSGTQAGDVCGTLSINHLGVKNAAQANCW